MQSYDKENGEDFMPPQKKTRAKNDPSEKRRWKQFLLRPLVTE